jgi:hypothetical protein
VGKTVVKPIHRPSEAALLRLRRLADRRLSPEEFQAGLDAPMSEDERNEILALIRWFRRRYPTPGQRLASARRSYLQWRKGQPDFER